MTPTPMFHIAKSCGHATASQNLFDQSS